MLFHLPSSSLLLFLEFWSIAYNLCTHSMPWHSFCFPFIASFAPVPNSKTNPGKINWEVCYEFDEWGTYAVHLKQSAIQNALAIIDSSTEITNSKSISCWCFANILSLYFSRSICSANTQNTRLTGFRNWKKTIRRIKAPIFAKNIK